MLNSNNRFPPPKIFTNALLRSQDITALIRDTETHERALFKLAPPQDVTDIPDANLPRRSTIHPSNRSQHKPSAVATLLGGELGERIRKENTKEGKERGDVDVDLLLKGAEKLCSVYPIAGAPERIVSLRSRYEQLNASIHRYETRVEKQAAQLARMNRHKDHVGDDDEMEDEEEEVEDVAPEMEVTEDDIQRENELIAELEKKKQLLEERVSGMERDLGGLLR